MRWSPFAPLDRHFAPAPDAVRIAFLSAQPFAHRGLHGGEVVENSREAFERAIAAGHGFECDVQASADGVAFVFHDYDLDRLTDESGSVAARSAAALSTVALSGADETLPRLTEILAMLDGRAPILIEIKSRDRRIVPICLSVRRALEGYRAPAAIMSFNPLVAAWFAENAPRIVRGLVVTEDGKKSLRGRLERHIALWKSRAQFLAYDIRDLPSTFAASQRSRGLPLLTWTVRTDEQHALANHETDAAIYEG